MLSLWANWLVTKFRLNSLKRYIWPVLQDAFSQILYLFKEDQLKRTNSNREKEKR